MYAKESYYVKFISPSHNTIIATLYDYQFMVDDDFSWFIYLIFKIVDYSNKAKIGVWRSINMRGFFPTPKKTNPSK